MNSAPLVSVCIPTYNRAGLLRQTVESIVSSPAFLDSEEVEIVVSDNASSDDTGRMMAEYGKRFPGRIVYFRQPEGVDPHFNFKNSLDLGNGRFLRLLNDRAVFRENMLAHFLEIHRANADASAIFTNEAWPENGRECFPCSSPDEVLKHCSVILANIALYSFRRDVYRSFPDPFREWESHFPHIDLLFRIMETGGKVIVVDNQFFDFNLHRYVNRNEASIFGRDYLNLLEKYAARGAISRETCRFEKKNALFMQIIPLYFDFHHKFNEEKRRSFRVFWNSMEKYRTEPYFYAAIPMIFAYKILCAIPIPKRVHEFARECYLFLHRGSPETKQIRQRESGEKRG